MVLMAEKDLRLDEIEEGLRILRWSFQELINNVKQMPEHRKLADSTFYRWRNGESKGRKKYASDALDLVRSEIQKLSPNDPQIKNSRHFSGNNEDQDSARGFTTDEISSARKLIAFKCRVVKTGAPWSAKQVADVTIRLSALLGAASTHIVIEGNLENIKSGSCISFYETDYDETGIFLLFKNRQDPDLGLIGWINPISPNQIQIGNQKTLPVDEWSVIGYAYCVSTGYGEIKKQLRINLDGIGPLS